MAHRVMIVGGAGFVGSHMARALMERGDHVVAFDIQRPSPQLQLVLGEYEDKVVFEQGSCVYLAEGYLRRQTAPG